VVVPTSTTVAKVLAVKAVQEEGVMGEKARGAPVGLGQPRLLGATRRMADPS